MAPSMRRVVCMRPLSRDAVLTSEPVEFTATRSWSVSRLLRRRDLRGGSNLNLSDGCAEHSRQRIPEPTGTADRAGAGLATA